MKVAAAKICLSCDEVYDLFEHQICPKCLEKYSVNLKEYFKPLVSAVADEIKKKTQRDQSTDILITAGAKHGKKKGKEAVCRN